MARYLEIIFRSKLRLFAILFVLPLALSAINLYLYRSYQASATVLVDDPNSYGPNASSELGYNPYMTPSQNAVIVFSNLVGTARFNDAVADELTRQGYIHSPQERASVIASLGRLTIMPGAYLPGAGGGGGGAGGVSANLTMSVQYICSKPDFCAPVILAVIDVLRTQWADIKIHSDEAAKAIYEKQLKEYQDKAASALAALQKYDALHPKAANQQSTLQDPVRTTLQHDLDLAQREVDQTSAYIATLSAVSQIPTAMSNNMTVVDGPTIQRGIVGIKGFRTDNLKTDATIWAICVAAAAAYIVLVVFVDRSVRDPHEIERRLSKHVVVIPDYQTQGRRGFRFGRRKPATPAPSSA